MPSNNMWTLLNLQVCCSLPSIYLADPSRSRGSCQWVSKVNVWIMAGSGQFFLSLSHTIFSEILTWMGPKKFEQRSLAHSQEFFSLFFPSQVSKKMSCNYNVKKILPLTTSNLTKECPNTIFLPDVVRSCTKAFFTTKRYALSIH